MFRNDFNDGISKKLWGLSEKGEYAEMRHRGQVQGRTLFDKGKMWRYFEASSEWNPPELATGAEPFPKGVKLNTPLEVLYKDKYSKPQDMEYHSDKVREDTYFSKAIREVMAVPPAPTIPAAPAPNLPAPTTSTTPTQPVAPSSVSATTPPTYFGQPRRTLLTMGPMENLPGRGVQETESEASSEGALSESASDRTNRSPRQEEKNDDPGEEPNKKMIGLAEPKMAESLSGHPGGKSPEQSWRDTTNGAKQVYETGTTEWKRGKLLSSQNELYSQELMGDDSPELQRAIEENQAELDALSVRPEKEGFIKSLGKNVLNWFGDVSDDVVAAAPKAVEGGAVGAALGARLPIPHPVGKGVTAAGGAILGAAAHGGAHFATETLREELGESYKDIRNIKDVNGKPVGKDVARTVSLAIVGVKTALDLGGGRLAKLVPGLDKGLDKVFLKAAGKVLKSERFKALAGKAAKEISEGATDVSVGVVQGMNQILMEDVVVAMEQENGREFAPKQRGEVMEVLLNRGRSAVTGTLLKTQKKNATDTITNAINK